jgi:hypothetical protein
MNNDTDPRTSQFIEAIIFSGALLVAHFSAFVVARSSMGLISRGYLAFTCLVLPIAALIGCITLRSARGWNWGQIVLVSLLALLMSFIQLLIVGEASAAV